MKRSEMVNLLASYIYIYPGLEINCSKSYELAESILEKIKEAGMLPPEHPTKMRELCVGSRGYTDIEVYEWEDETDS